MDTATHVWLYNPTTGGYWQCPVAAVADYLASGWERAEQPPPPPNPAVAEALAWREQQRAAAEAEAVADPDSQPTAAPRRKTEE